MTIFPDHATEIVVETLVPRVCRKSLGGWHNRLYSITCNPLGGNDSAGIAAALLRLWLAGCRTDWTNRVFFLSKQPQTDELEN